MEKGMTDQARITLTLEIDYTLNGITPESLAEILRANLVHMIGRGMLTDHSDAEVDLWVANTKLGEIDDRPI